MDVATSNQRKEQVRRSAGKHVIHAPNGYAFVKGRGTMLIRERAEPERIAMVLSAQLKRCGWPTHNLKVRGKKPNFFVNIGYLRGLDPNALYSALLALPEKCGATRIIHAIKRLPEQVEVGA